MLTQTLPDEKIIFPKGVWKDICTVANYSKPLSELAWPWWGCPHCYSTGQFNPDRRPTALQAFNAVRILVTYMQAGVDDPSLYNHPVVVEAWRVHDLIPEEIHERLLNLPDEVV